MIVFLAISNAASQAGETVDLRGYGKVSAELTPNRGVFACDSVEKADVLLDKLQLDLFWDKTLPVKTSELKLDSGPVTIYTLPGYGSALIARAGTLVIVLGGADEQAVTALANKETLLNGKDVTSHAAKPHPSYLDYFDNKAFTVNIRPMSKRAEFDRSLMRTLGGGFNIMGPVFEMSCPAPGVRNWVEYDYEIREAERQKDIISVGAWAGPVPLWARNLDPNSMVQPSGTTIVGDWNGSMLAGSNIESWMAPLDQRLQRGLGYQRSVVERYRSSPAVGGWMIFAGEPGWEYSLGHGRAMNAWDASPTGQAGWRRWLQEGCHYSLTDLGKRWYGDPKHFSTWEEVLLPDLNEFYGALGSDSFRLNTGWRWQNRPESATGPVDPKSDGWVPVAVAPSQQIAFLPRTGLNYYDITMDPSAWLAKQPKGSDVWVVVGFLGSTPMWLNGQALKVPQDDASHNGSFAVRVTDLLKPGVNNLQIAVKYVNVFQNCGQLSGPVFLTTHEPKRFPYLGRQANARFADLTNWRGWAVTDYHRELIRMTRKLDPDRPFVLSGGRGNLFDYGDQLCSEFNMSQQNTGREAGYRPWSPASGLAGGYYGTSEFSAAPKGASLDQGFAWTMIDADSRHNLCGDVTEYMRREQTEGWYSKRKRLINMFGKYLREQPQVALLYSGQSHRFSPIGYSDIGVDAMPATHYDQVYVSEIGLRKGLAAPYRVLFDIGNQFMEPADVSAIQKHVAQGGSFIALNNSGLHTGIDPNSYPLSIVSGFKPTEARNGKIRFESRLPMFKGWENKEFQTTGMALAPIASGDNTLIPLARWNDGSIAIGYRTVGKGQVITLGCMLWRDAKDLSGAWKTQGELQQAFFTQLYSDCGVTRTADASTPELWARKMVTKNGLQNWLMTFNTTNKANQGDVWMAVDAKPDQVIDLETNESVTFVYENKGITLKGVQFNPLAIKVFAVRRATLAGAMSGWWYEKTRYWKRTAAEVEAGKITLPDIKLARDESVIAISNWSFQTDPDQQIVKQGKWTSPTFKDADWQTKEAGPWNLFDSKLKDFQGTGLYRFKFTVPPIWKGRRVLLNLYSFSDPIVYDTGEFFVNGALVATYKAHGWNQTYNYDVTDLLHPGENVLAIKVAGGADWSGLSGCVWIEAKPILSQTQDLGGDWQAVQADWMTRTRESIPNNGIKAKYLTREFRIPSTWKDKDIFVDWSSKNQWVGSLVINGRPINYNSSAHPYGLISRVNVNPFIKPGENNIIELWPFKTMTWAGTTVEADAPGLQIDSIRIGCK